MRKIICLLILGTQIGCTPNIGIVQVKPEVVSKIPEKQVPVVTKSAEPVPIVKVSAQPEKDGSAGTKQSGDAQNVALPSVSPSPSVIVSPMPSASPSVYACVGNIGSGVCTPAVNEKINNPYSVAYPVPVDARSGGISLIFNDKFKLSYDKTQKVFKSLIGQDTSNINQLMSQYKVIMVYDSLGSLTQEQADADEKHVEQAIGYDSPNLGSLYAISVKDINVKEFVEKLRVDSLVREANYSLGVKID